MGTDLSRDLFPLNSFFTIFQTSLSSVWGGEAAKAVGARRPAWEPASIPSAARRELDPTVLQGRDRAGARGPQQGKPVGTELVAAAVPAECVSSVRIHSCP